MKEETKEDRVIFTASSTRDGVPTAPPSLAQGNALGIRGIIPDFPRALKGRSSTLPHSRKPLPCRSKAPRLFGTPFPDDPRPFGFSEASSLSIHGRSVFSEWPSLTIPCPSLLPKPLPSSSKGTPPFRPCLTQTSLAILRFRLAGDPPAIFPKVPRLHAKASLSDRGCSGSARAEDRPRSSLPMMIDLASMRPGEARWSLLNSSLRSAPSISSV